MSVFYFGATNLTIGSCWLVQAGSNLLLFLFGYVKVRNCTVNQQVQDCPGKPAWKNAAINGFLFLWTLDEPSVLGPTFSAAFPFA